MRVWSSVAVSLLMVAGCGDDDGGADATGTASETGPTISEAQPYLLLEDPSWHLVEAVDYGADSPFATAATAVLPAIDWFAEYDHDPVDLGGGAERVDHLVVSVVDSPVDEVAEGYTTLGFLCESIVAGSWTALGCSGPEEGQDGVFLEAGDLTVAVDSPDLTVDELATVAAALEPADESAWTTAGGITQ